MPTSCSAPCGSRPEAKEKFSPAFGFFLLCFFLREVIFYSGFILKEKQEQKSLCLSPQSLPCFLCICLKTLGLLLGAEGKDAVIESSFCPAALASHSSQNPVIWCLRGRRGALISLLQTAGPLPCQLQRRGVQRGWLRGQPLPGPLHSAEAPPLRLLGLPYPLPAPPHPEPGVNGFSQAPLPCLLFL